MVFTTEGLTTNSKIKVVMSGINKNPIASKYLSQITELLYSKQKSAAQILGDPKVKYKVTIKGTSLRSIIKNQKGFFLTL